MLIHPPVRGKKKKNQTKRHIKGSIQAAQEEAADKWVSPARARREFQAVLLQQGFGEPSCTPAAAKLLLWKGNLQCHQLRRKHMQRVLSKCSQGVLFIPTCVPSLCSLPFSPTLWDHQGTPDVERHLSFAVWSSQVNQRAKGTLRTSSKTCSLLISQTCRIHQKNLHIFCS